jgi:hypothetical protein
VVAAPDRLPSYRYRSQVALAVLLGEELAAAPIGLGERRRDRRPSLGVVIDEAPGHSRAAGDGRDWQSAFSRLICLSASWTRPERSTPSSVR